MQYFLLIPTLRYKSNIAGSVVQEKNYFLHSSGCCPWKHKPKLQRELGQQKAQEIHVSFTASYLHKVSSSCPCFCTSTYCGSALECHSPIELLDFFQFTEAYNFYSCKIKSRLSCNCFLCSQLQTVNWEANVPYIDETHGIIYIYINGRHNRVTSSWEEYLGFANNK